jgi:hypothetical protein
MPGWNGLRGHSIREVATKLQWPPMRQSCTRNRYELLAYERGFFVPRVWERGTSVTVSVWL